MSLAKQQLEMATQLALGLADLNQRDEWYWYVVFQQLICVPWVACIFTSVFGFLLSSFCFSLFGSVLQFVFLILFVCFFVSAFFFFFFCFFFFFFFDCFLKYSSSLCQLELARLYAESVNFPAAIECIGMLLKALPNLRTEFKVRRILYLFTMHLYKM